MDPASSSSQRFNIVGMDIDREIGELKVHIKRLAGDNRDRDGHPYVKFGVLARDSEFESLIGALKVAMQRNIVRYNAEPLLKDGTEDVDIILLQE